MKSKAHFSQGMLLFHLTTPQPFALGTLKIKEIIQFTGLTSIPNSHPEVKGAITVRGHTIPVVDMSSAIGHRQLTREEMKSCFIIVTDCQRKEIGFLVSAIDKIMECNWREITPPPNSLGKNAYLTGVTKFENKLVQVLDVEYLLSKIFPESIDNRLPILTDVQREQLKPLNILLVDDSLVARKQLSDALDAMNIPYAVTSNGQDALNIMIEQASSGTPIDLLVSDIEMPGLNGYELAFDIRNDKRLDKAYIILHTSLSSHISVSQAQQVGANEALTKFDANELIQAMLRGAGVVDAELEQAS